MNLMREEIGQQAAIVAAMAADRDRFTTAATQARASQVQFVLYVARGTSDNAAVYGQYLATIAAGLPAGLAVPSAATVYGASIDLRNCLVIGISQSGETPDVAEYLRYARAAGAYTLAITNSEASRVADVAHSVLATQAGPERAIAATKTYTSQLAALALFWSAWTNDEGLGGAVHTLIPKAMDVALALEEPISKVAARLSHAERLLVSGRGFNYATALETALKVEETCYVPALAYSASDFRHGPMALLEPRYPVLLFATQGPALSGMTQLHQDVRARGAETIVVTDAESRFHDATVVLPLPPDVPEPLSPLVAVVAGQLLALRLSLARGLDPDRPRGLSKITRTS